MRSSGAGSDLGPACTCPAVVPPIVEEKCHLCPCGSAVTFSDLQVCQGDGVVHQGVSMTTKPHFPPPLAEPADHSAGLAGEKRQRRPTPAASLRGPPHINDFSGSLHLPAQQPSASPPGSSSHGQCPPVQPAPHVHLRPQHCGHAGLHHVHRPPVLPAGLIAPHHLRCPPQHPGAPGPCQRGAQPADVCQRPPSPVPTPVRSPVLYWCFQRICYLHWIPAEPHQDQPVLLLVVAGEALSCDGPERLEEDFR